MEALGLLFLDIAFANLVLIGAVCAGLALSRRRVNDKSAVRLRAHGARPH